MVTEFALKTRDHSLEPQVVKINTRHLDKFRTLSLKTEKQTKKNSILSYTFAFLICHDLKSVMLTFSKQFDTHK